MSATEVLVTLFGLFIGYWVISSLASGRSDRGATRSTNARPQGDADPQNSHDASQEPAHRQEPHWRHVLGVPSDASLAQIKAAYRKLISDYHPDRVASMGDELKVLCDRKSKEINVAYEQAMHEFREAP